MPRQAVRPAGTQGVLGDGPDGILEPLARIDGDEHPADGDALGRLDPDPLARGWTYQGWHRLTSFPPTSSSSDPRNRSERRERRATEGSVTRGGVTRGGASTFYARHLPPQC